MAFAFGHIVGGWVFGKGLEMISWKKLSYWEWCFLMFGAMLPDIDFVLEWAFNIESHRTFTHSFVFMAVSFAALILTARIAEPVFAGRKIAGRAELRKKAVIYGICLCIGIFVHFLLDMAFGKPGITLLWPLNYGFWFFGIEPFGIHGVFYGTINTLIIKIKFMIAEMFIGTAWLWWMIATRRLDLSSKPQIKFK